MEPHHCIHFKISCCSSASEKSVPGHSCRGSSSAGTPSIHTAINLTHAYQKNKCGKPQTPSCGRFALLSNICASSQSARTNNARTLVATSEAQPRKQVTRVWTCPYCSMRIESDKPGKDLSTKRRNHLNYRHKGLHRDKEDTISSRTIAIAPSKELPLQERGWTCGLCNKGLPPLPRHQREHSINTHYKTQHPRAKYNFRSALKQRWKKWKQAPESDPIRTEAREKGIKTLWQTMDKKRKESNGHTLVFFKPDWPTLPVRSDAKKARSSPRRGRACTCTACYRTAFRGNLPKGQCPGTADANFQGTKNVWDRVQSSPATLQRLLACWSMSKQEAEQKLFN